MLAQTLRNLIGVKGSDIISTRNGELGLSDGPTLLTRGALGESHVLFSLIDVQA